MPLSEWLETALWPENNGIVARNAGAILGSATNDKIAAQKAMCILLYAMAKGSFRMMGRMFKKNHSLIYRWIRAFGETLPEPKVSGDIKEVEFDELWHFIVSKKTNFGSSKPLTVVQGEPWPGCSAVVILQHSEGVTTK